MVFVCFCAFNSIHVITENVSAPSFLAERIALYLSSKWKGGIFSEMLRLHTTVGGIQKRFFGRLGWFLAANKRGSAVFDGVHAWTMTQELAPGIWCETTCENMGASEQIQFLSFSEMTPAKGCSSPVSAEHWSSHKGNEEGVGAMLLSHITFELPITRLMVSVCDDLQKMLILFNRLLVRKVGNHWPNVCL